MIIGSSALQHIVSKAVAHTTLDTSDKDAFASAAMATVPVAPVAGSDDTSAQSGTQEQPTYDEAFAKMMVNLKSAMASTTENAIDPQMAAASSMMAGADKQVASTDSVASSTSDSIDALSASAVKDNASSSSSSSSSVGSAKDEFLAYMNQTDGEKARQQLTGVTKEEYAAMSPEEKAAVDKKVADLTKEKAEVAQQEIKAKIAMAKSEMA